MLIILRLFDFAKMLFRIYNLFAFDLEFIMLLRFWFRILTFIMFLLRFVFIKNFQNHKYFRTIS